MMRAHTRCVGRGPGALSVLLVLVFLAGPALAGSREPEKEEKKPHRFTQFRPHGLHTGAWRIERGWDEEAEAEFARFVAALGAAREKAPFTLAEGLRSPRHNPLYSEEDKALQVTVDCATFPYVVRAYFAWKTRRPFSYQSNKCRRYGKENGPREFADFSQFASFPELLDHMTSSISSGHFRMKAWLEGTDTYPVVVNRETIRPGLVYYDPNGHVLMVYHVGDHSGEIRFLDAHPDGTMTIRTFGRQYAIGSAKYGGGFRAWRHYRIEPVDVLKGSFRMVRSRNDESAHFSAENQYHWRYRIDEFELLYHDWVAAQVSRNGIYTYPVEDFGLLLDNICLEVGARVNSVNAGMNAGLHRKTHPNELPYNIFGASGEWEEYATPGRDVRIKAAFSEAYEFVQKTMVMAREGSGRLRYDCEPWELHEEYRRIWQAHVGNAICQWEYTNSAGEAVHLDLNDVAFRLFDLSFDPYHCPELRWGAHADSPDEDVRAEAATCPADNRKEWWYREEARLRNRTTRLLGHGTGTHRGPRKSPQVHIPTLLDCYDQAMPEFAQCHDGIPRDVRRAGN